MEYKCVNCDWNGPWDELILETMCPHCRSTTTPLPEQGGLHDPSPATERVTPPNNILTNP